MLEHYKFFFPDLTKIDGYFVIRITDKITNKFHLISSGSDCFSYTFNDLLYCISINSSRYSFKTTRIYKTREECRKIYNKLLDRCREDERYDRHNPVFPLGHWSYSKSEPPKNMKYFVYKVIHEPSGLLYIGKKQMLMKKKYYDYRYNTISKVVESDWKFYKTSSTKFFRELQRNKYNFKFEILKFFTGKSKCDVYEQEIIKEYKEKGNCVNGKIPEEIKEILISKEICYDYDFQ